MDVYLVRKGSNGVAVVTFSKRRAIARAAKLANDELKSANDRVKTYGTFDSRHYELIKKSKGYDAKIWCKILYLVRDDGNKEWSNSYWVQQHQTLDTPLEMLAQAAE